MGAEGLDLRLAGSVGVFFGMKIVGGPSESPPDCFLLLGFSKA